MPTLDGENVRMGPQTAGLIVRTSGSLAGGEARPHDFRHLFAMRLLTARAGHAIAQKLLGHSSVDVTTRVCWHAEAEGLAEAYARFHRPVVGPPA